MQPSQCTLQVCTRSALEGWTAILVLKLLQIVLLYSGILTVLSQLMGHPSHTAIGISTMTKIWTFNFLLVLLGSSIVGALYQTIDEVLGQGMCVVGGQGVLLRCGSSLDSDRVRADGHEDGVWAEGHVCRWVCKEEGAAAERVLVVTQNNVAGWGNVDRFPGLKSS